MPETSKLASAITGAAFTLGSEDFDLEYHVLLSPHWLSWKSRQFESWQGGTPCQPCLTGPKLLP